MVATFGSNLLSSRSPAHALTITASSSSCSRERPAHPATGTSVSLRRAKTDTQKRDALPLTLDPPKTEQSLQMESMDFDDFIAESEVPILVDFYAPWCGPCQLMSKVVKDISAELQDRLKVVKINTDNYPKLASKYRVKGLPTCLLFRDGSIIDRVDGFMPEPTFGKRVRFYVSRLDTKFGRR